MEERSTRLTAANERLTRQVESQQAVVRQGGNADTRRFLRENRRLDEENRENRAKLREYEDSLNINDADITKTDVFLGAGSFGGKSPFARVDLSIDSSVVLCRRVGGGMARLSSCSKNIQRRSSEHFQRTQRERRSGQL